MTGCQCHGPGYCERHGVNKTKTWFALCKTSEKYFSAWEQGKGPGQKFGKSGTEPTIVKKAWNLAASLAKFVCDGFKLATKEEYTRRMMICDGCERRNGNWCRECGCNLSVKVRGRVFECPIKKWEQ
jgi:hypothetical protein